MTMTRTFKDLVVYSKAFDVAVEIHKATLTFPKIEQYALADQMRRASKGICSNIAEGFGKQNDSRAEFKRFLSMAQGSASEMIVWIEFCAELNYVDESQSSKWLDTYDHISRMLNKLKTSSNKRISQ